MSFINCYQFAKKHTKKPLSDLDANEIIKIEKLLKTEVRIAPELFSTNDVENFINAIKSKSEIIDFLGIDSSFYDLLLGVSYQADFSQNARYDDFDKDVLRQEMEAFLKQDIEKVINGNVEKNKYWKIKQLLVYKDILPYQVLDLLVNRVDYKLQAFIHFFEKTDGIKDELELQQVYDLVQIIDSKILYKTKARFESLKCQSIADIENHIDKPGIILFFQSLFLGFYYLFYEPTEIGEIKKKKRVMGDFYFTIGLLAFVLVIILIGVLIFGGKESKKEPVKMSKEQSFYGSFIVPYQNNVRFIGPYFDTLQTGFDFMTSKNIRYDGKFRKLLIENNTNSDMIVFSDFEYLKMKEEMGIKKDSGIFIFIKKNDTLSIDAKNKPLHFYFGNQLYSTLSPDQNPANLPRFYLQHLSNQKIISEPFEIRALKISFKDSLKSIIVAADEKFFVHGISYSSKAF